jgi:hypothetical protein
MFLPSDIPGNFFPQKVRYDAAITNKAVPEPDMVQVWRLR